MRSDVRSLLVGASVVGLAVVTASCDRLLGLQQRPPDAGGNTGEMPPDKDADKPTGCFIEEFTGATLDGRWTIVNATNPDIVMQQENKLTISFRTPGSLGSNAIRAPGLNLTSATVTAQLVMASGTNTGTAMAIVQRQGITPSYAFDVRGSRLLLFVGANRAAELTYNAAAHRFLRFRQESGSIAFETSADRSTWLTDAEVPQMDPVTDVELWIGGSIHAAPLPAATSALWDDLEVTKLGCTP